MHGRAELGFASSSCCKQMVMELLHIDEGILNLVLTDAQCFYGVQVGSSIETSDHSALFIDVGRERPILHLVCRQEVYLKN